uniref:Uncharacterized protein n=1 Tax=Hyaloperonospora arabidopsidis (strain Emoy2) TaxID=559515 RepID=M4BMC4_HYAAE
MERKSAREESGMPRQRGGLIRCTGRSSDLASGNGSTGVEPASHPAKVVFYGGIIRW